MGAAANSPERGLWLAVISNALTDAAAPPDARHEGTRHDRLSSRAWFRITNPDFREVCFLAGVEPEAVIAAFHRQTGQSEALEKAA